MSSNLSPPRRAIIKSSLFGLLAASIPNVLYCRPHNYRIFSDSAMGSSLLPKAYPAIDPEIVHEVVSKSHSDLVGVKKLVDRRPELAKAVWDWRFGDWETAIGAASHVGRRDIAKYLLQQGARPTIFTFAMLGAFKTVKSMIDYSPGIQRVLGPHGISLLDHARAGQRMKNGMNSKNIDSLERLIEYLELLGDANGPKYLNVSEDEKEQYLGDYKYGLGDKEGFTISLNMRKMISLGEIGTFGGTLYKIDDNKFMYQGAPSVNVTFQFKNGKVHSLIVQEPNLRLKAGKI